MKDERLPDAPDQSLRGRALERIEKKQEFHAHLLAYVLVNALLVGIWAVTGAEFFWPVFLLLGWGIGIGFRVGHVPGRRAERTPDPARDGAPAQGRSEVLAVLGDRPGTRRHYPGSRDPFSAA